MRPLAAACCAFLLAIAPLARADNVNVYAAASLREAIEAHARGFEKATGHRVVAVFAASNTLARQIDAGAPADLFISADLEWALHVESRGHAVPGSRFDLVSNELVLIAPAKSTASLKLVPGVSLAPALGSKRLALADPQAVPAGIYAKSALLSLGAWEGVKEHLAPAESVRAALAFVATGESPLGIVYRTDALAERGVRVVDTFPESTHPPIVYPLVVLKRAKPPAQQFADYLTGAEARATWQHLGFTFLR